MSFAAKQVQLLRAGFYVLGGFAFGPGIVAVGEDQAFGQRRMRIEPESDDGGWIGIGQADFSQHLEGVCGDFRGIRNDAVNHFEAIDVSGVLLGAAEAVGHRHSDKGQHL